MRASRQLIATRPDLVARNPGLLPWLPPQLPGETFAYERGDGSRMYLTWFNSEIVVAGVSRDRMADVAHIQPIAWALAARLVDDDGLVYEYMPSEREQMAAEPVQAEPDLLPLLPGNRRGWHIRRSRWLARHGRPLRQLAWNGLVLVAIPAGLVIVAIAGSLATYRSVEAATGHGTKGYFVCVHHTHGIFRLPDGEIGRLHVTFADPPPELRPGAVIAALDTGDATFVFARHGSRHWVTNAALMSLIVAAAGLWAWFVPLRARRRRRAIKTAPDPGRAPQHPVP
ncbi:MAG TPA: hypothetical protein VF940_30940 [Streptosporangiaceae bacterium]